MKKIYSILSSFLLTIATTSLTLIVFSNCSNNTEKTEIPVTENTIYWDCTNIGNEELKLSSIFKEYSLLALEEKDEALVGQVSKIALHDSLLFVSDNNVLDKIFVFNNTSGKFLHSIGKIGQGPGEYYSLNDFSIDSENEKLYLLCNMENIYSYSLDGTFLEAKKIPFYASCMEYQNDMFIFRCDSRSSHHLIITDNQFNVVAKHLDNELYKENDRMQVHHFQKREDGVLFHRFLDNNIYKFDKDGNKYIAYQLDFGKDAIDMAEISSYTDGEVKNTLKEGIFYKYFTETDNYAFLVFFKEAIPHISFYDKLHKKSITCKFEDITNDLFNGEFPVLEYEAAPNGFVGLLSLDAVERLKSEGVLNDNFSTDANYVFLKFN